MPREGAGRRAAVPEGQRVLPLVERDGIAEEHRLPGQLHTHPHRQRPVYVRLAGRRHAEIVEHRQHRAHGSAERGEEVRLAA